MKHIFLIHSNTVLLSALGAISHENIVLRDVLFLFSRNFKSSIIPSEIHIKDISNLINYSCSRDFCYNIVKQDKYIKEIDTFIDTEVKDDYIMYVPHAGAPFNVFITNKRCLNSCLLQEGAYSFFGVPKRDIKTKLKNLLFSNNRIWWTKTWDIPECKRHLLNLTKTYAIDESFFKPIKDTDNIVIKWPSINGDKRFYFPEKTNFFLFETVVEEGFASIESYLACCKKLIEDSGVSHCYLKFHPAQNENNITRIKSLFKGLEIELVDNTIPFELVLSTSKNLNLYGFSTSLLKFGSVLGHNITTYLDLLLTMSTKKYRDHLIAGKYI